MLQVDWSQSTVLPKYSETQKDVVPSIPSTIQLCITMLKFRDYQSVMIVETLSGIYVL